MSPCLPPLPSHQSFLLPIATKLSSSLVPMVDKQIIPYGADLNKKPDALVLSTIPPEVTPICSNQSYYAQAIRRPLIAPPPPPLHLEGKPFQQEPITFSR